MSSGDFYGLYRIEFEARQLAERELDDLRESLRARTLRYEQERQMKLQERLNAAAIQHQCNLLTDLLERAIHFMENVPTDAQLDAMMQNGDTGRKLLIDVEKGEPALYATGLPSPPVSREMSDTTAPSARGLIFHAVETRNAGELARVAEVLAGRVEKVLELHYEGGMNDHPWCAECGADWPCPTVRLLNEEE